MRSALIWAFLLLCSLGYPADILILVHQKEAGPVVPQTDYEHPTWILWPKSSNILQSNRLFSLPTGVDWQTGFLDDVFVLRPRSARLVGPKKWTNRGWVEAIKRNLGEPKVFSVAPESGEPSREVLKTAMVSLTQIPIVHRDEPWPTTGLLVAEARGRNPWDEVAFLTQKAGGRALVVEYPDLNTTMWSRVWLMGKGWPEGVPIPNSTRIPGLIPARDLMRLVSIPTSAIWEDQKSIPANRWLGFGHDVAPVALVFLAVASIYVIGLGIYCAMREQFSRIAITLIRILISGPAALILGGKLTSLNTPADWAIWHLAAFVAVVTVIWITNRIATKWIPDCHPLWGEFAVGMFVCAGIDPVWSVFSNVLGPHRAPINPEAFGAFTAYAVGSSFLFSSKKWSRAIWLALAIGGSAALLIFSHWLVGISSAIAVLILVMLTRGFEGRLRYGLIIVLGLGLFSALYKPGLAYAPQGLVYTFAQVGKFNCAEQIAFLLSPTFISFCLVAIVAGIVGDNFLGHQARRAMSFSPKPKVFFYAALCFALAGVFIPLYLHAFLATAIAGAVTVLFDAIRVP